MPRKKKKNQVMTSLWLDIDLREKLEELEKKEDRTMGWLINQLVREGLERRGL